ncbi:MAG: hypothetical protein HPY89_00745 [Pelotomaculum sp.]|nr:hypothetical protein [Pelotomaculum sp.]
MTVNYSREAEINELYDKVLNRVILLSPVKAKALLKKAEKYFKNELEGETLEVGLLFIEAIRKNYKRYIEI